MPEIMHNGQPFGYTMFEGERGGPVPIPYAFGVGAVNIAGMLYVYPDDLDRSYSDGVFAGVVVGTYHLDKDDVEACANNGLVKVCIKLDIDGKRLLAKGCTRKLNPFDPGWDCSKWKQIVKW